MNISAINTAAPRTNVNFNGGMMDKMAEGVAKGFSKLGNTKHNNFHKNTLNPNKVLLKYYLYKIYTVK